jgi:hypothetical protein
VTRRVLLYKIEWATEAWTEVQALRVFDRRAIMQAVAELAHQAESETQNRNTPE